MNRTAERQMQTWKLYLGRTEDEIRERFPIAESEIDRESFYGELSGLTVLYDFDTYPGHFIFKDGRCILFYVEDISDALGEMTPEDLVNILGGPATDLPSHAGRASRHYVYPSRGIGYSANYKSVDYMEVFAPTTLDDYLARFYRKPR